MILEEYQTFIVLCDICGSKGGSFSDFYDAVEFKKENGWKSQKRNGEWEDVCPECQKTEEKATDTLECSSLGDKRFSALHARVSVFGRIDTIENHYQLSKRFGKSKPETWRDAKGRKPTHIQVGNVEFPVKCLTAWYAALWLKYLNEHPELVQYAQTYSKFHDTFAKKGTNSQAEMVRLYAKQGRGALYALAEPILQTLRKQEI